MNDRRVSPMDPKMTPTLRLAVIVLDEAHSLLEACKDSPEGLKLSGEWRAYRRVLHGVVVERRPLAVTVEQEGALLGRVIRLNKNIGDLADQLSPLEESGARLAWSGAVEKLRSGAA